jgi:peptidoglycan hydrolase CwlO-like protein
MPLAQLSADMLPSGFVSWILCASGAVFLVNQVLTFYKDHFRETPAPAHTYATKADMDAELGRERGARKKMYEEMGGVQKSITALQKETTHQSADIQAIKQKVEKLDERIDVVPERTIKLLRETKGLI